MQKDVNDEQYLHSVNKQFSFKDDLLFLFTFSINLNLNTWVYI